LRSAMEQAYEKTAEQIDSAPFHTLHTEPRIFEGVKFHRVLALRTAGNDRDSVRWVVQRLFNRLGHRPRVWSFDATFRVEAANVPDHHFLLRLAGPELLVEPFERNEALDLVQVSLHRNDVDLALLLHDVSAEDEHDVVLCPRRVKKLRDCPFNNVAQRRDFPLRAVGGLPRFALLPPDFLRLLLFPWLFF